MKQRAHNLPKNSPNVNDEYLQKTKAAYEDPDLVQDYWERTKDHWQKFKSLNKGNIPIDQFVTFLWPRANVVDLGCGPGRDSIYLASKGLTVTGIDYSTQMIAKAKELHGGNDHLTFMTMDMMDLDFTDNSFDGVWACASLLHIPKRSLSRVLKGVYRILKEDGLFYVRVKEGSGEKYIKEDKYTKPMERFFSFFTPGEIQKVIEHAGFRTISLNTEGSLSDSSTTWISIFSRKV